MIDLVIFILVISIIVIFHEFGHFIAAKISKIPVQVFAIGFGPSIFKYTKGETTYKINIFLFGGYVSLLGEGDFENESDPRSFENQPNYKKLFVAVSGVLMNLVFAALVFTLYLSITSFKTYLINLSDIHFLFGNQSNVIGIQAINNGNNNSPAYKVLGSTPYVLDTIDNKTFGNTLDVVNYVNTHKGEPLKFTLSNALSNQPKEVEITPLTNPPKGQGALGVSLDPEYEISYTGIGKIFSGIGYTIDATQYNVKVIYNLIVQSIQTKNATAVQSSVTGPVGIYEVSGYYYNHFGILGIVNLAGTISIGLAIANILPIPVLDGGLALFIIIETITRRKINPKVKAVVTNIGLLLILVLFVLFTLNDINNFQIISAIKSHF